MSEPHYRFAQRFSSTTEQRLEEIRQIFREAEPIHSPSALERLDVDAIEDRRIFKRRFGYDWSLRFHREALVKLRQERDWTDFEVRLFLLSGTLQRGPLGVQPAPSNVIAALGLLLMTTMLAFVVLTLALLIERAASMDVNLMVRGGGVALLFAWFAYHLYIRPWRLLRRRSESA